MRRQIQLEKAFTPVVKATKESIDKIRKLRRMELLMKVRRVKISLKKAIDYYLNLKSNKDEYYGK